MTAYCDLHKTKELGLPWSCLPTTAEHTLSTQEKNPGLHKAHPARHQKAETALWCARALQPQTSHLTSSVLSAVTCRMKIME